MKLYELTGQFQEALTLAEQSTGEDDQNAWLDTLIGIEEELQTKLDGCAAVCKSLEAEAKALKTEEERIRFRRQSFENQVERLKAYMFEGMKAAGLSKSKGKLFTVAIQANPERVVLDVEKPEQLPRQFQVVEVKANVSAIKEKLQESDGEIKGFAHLERGESLRIR